MAPTRKRAPARRSARARARSRPARSSRRRTGPLARWRRMVPIAPRLPVLDQRQRDVLGLALLAAAVFSGFVLYGSGGPGAAGGRAGEAIAVALGWTLGGARVLAPVALGVAGGALLLAPVLPAMRPLRAGA